MKRLRYLEQPDKIHLDFLPESKGGKWFTLCEDLNVELSNGDWITIPKGFKTDLASVPKLLWGFFPPFGVDLIAYLIHDYLYVTKLYNRSFSDKEMYLWAKHLRDENIDPYLRYKTVRVLGGYVWSGKISV